MFFWYAILINWGGTSQNYEKSGSKKWLLTYSKQIFKIALESRKLDIYRNTDNASRWYILLLYYSLSNTFLTLCNALSNYVGKWGFFFEVDNGNGISYLVFPKNGPTVWKKYATLVCRVVK